MRRALREYEVVGIRTTIPFFEWVLEDADFLAARFDTTFIDRKLADRRGAPFQTATPEQEDLAAVAAALHTVLRAPARAAERPHPASRWRDQARVEGLR
jgi:acetyl-CoA carboxylase biotin carboxylase subunit